MFNCILLTTPHLAIFLIAGICYHFIYAHEK